VFFEPSGSLASPVRRQMKSYLRDEFGGGRETKYTRGGKFSAAESGGGKKSRELVKRKGTGWGR